MSRRASRNEEIEVVSEPKRTRTKTKVSSRRKSLSEVVRETKEAKESADALDKALQYEKKIYDLEQLLDIAKSFCQNLDFDNLLESIVYICMAQMHVLGAEIFVRDLITNENYVLETAKDLFDEGEKPSIPVSSSITKKLLDVQMPITFDELKLLIDDQQTLSILNSLSPTLIVPLIQKSHLNGLLILQERIAIEDDVSYTDYELNQIMSIASLASVAINNAALIEQSSTDMMTHLKLKFYFFNILSEAIDEAFLQNQNVAVLMFDIDYFKSFNDTYGHAVGDRVLQRVADILRHSFRSVDVLCRIGGDEFAVIMTRVNSSMSQLVMNKIKKAAELLANPKDDLPPVTLSVGIAFADRENPQGDIFKDADTALYRVKEAGRNGCQIY